jgi:hypothetical protein
MKGKETLEPQGLFRFSAGGNECENLKRRKDIQER